MATEFKLSYTAAQVNEKLGQIDSLAKKSELPTKLSQLENDSGFVTVDIPVFDLAALGMAAVAFPTGASVLEMDTTEIASALDAGDVKFNIPVSMSGTVINGLFTMQSFTDGYGNYQCTSIAYFGMLLVAMVIVESGNVTVTIQPLGVLPTISAADNGKFLRVVDGAWAAVAVEIAEEESV